jgi:hypothetical protein
MRIHTKDIELIDAATADMLRRRSKVNNMQRALSMFAFGRDLVQQAVRDQHPDWPEQQVREEAFRRMHGERT